MSPKAAEVLEQAQKLSEDERRELAIELLDSAVAPEESSRPGSMKRGDASRTSIPAKSRPSPTKKRCG